MSGLKQRRNLDENAVLNQETATKALATMLSKVNSTEKTDDQVQDVPAEEPKAVEAEKSENSVHPAPIGFFAALTEMFTTDFAGIAKKGE
ncbi:unnamed protein product [Bursaphelenchus xylophilus]|uniref:(pine wood nematode) hypothetical protein n=1 Tax=Bursaphelenchus xylophilus TaxID=6326 RepID=A0A1I7RW91_BURXY|nr:unnamed protein product [Bursaphelenchus xylophilus]CAG9095297.1 unnamed protein product [Bursaphelenchus xylophilus]